MIEMTQRALRADREGSNVEFAVLDYFVTTFRFLGVYRSLVISGTLPR